MSTAYVLFAFRPTICIIFRAHKLSQSTQNQFEQVPQINCRYQRGLTLIQNSLKIDHKKRSVGRYQEKRIVFGRILLLVDDKPPIRVSLCDRYCVHVYKFPTFPRSQSSLLLLCYVDTQSLPSVETGQNGECDRGVFHSPHTHKN